MEGNLVKTKKHLKLPIKALLFLLISLQYVFSFVLGLVCFIIGENLSYEYDTSDSILTVASIIGALLPLAVIILCEHILYKKTDMPASLLLFTPILLNIIGVLYYILLLYDSGDYYAESEIDIIIFYICAVGIIKALLGAINFIKNKKFKLIPLCFVLAMIGFLCYPVCSWYKTNVYYANIGESDLTSSWSSINQIINRDESWREIVTDTEFTLGEITEGLNNGEKEYYCDRDTFPHIDGSTVCVPMAVEFARQHLNFDDSQSRDITNFSTTHWAYMNLIDKTDCGQVGFLYKDSFLNIPLGTVDLVIATHPSEEELKTAEKKGVELMMEPVCYDAFVFITHKDNPVESLTAQQIKDIYSGKIKNWKEVGGKDEKIRAFQREANSGSQTAMERLVMGGADMIDPIEVKVIEGMGGLVDAVAEYENETASIGYTYRYYIDNLYKNDEIKSIAVEGIFPTDENIRSGAYPYTTNYYGVIRKDDEERIGGKFLKWILGEEGQACVKQAGYITMAE